MCFCLFVIYWPLNQENVNGHKTVFFFRYRFDKTLRKRNNLSVIVSHFLSLLFTASPVMQINIGPAHRLMVFFSAILVMFYDFLEGIFFYHSKFTKIS